MTERRLDLCLWWGAWLLVLAVALWFRLWQLGSQILIDDEWHALHQLMLRDYREIFLSFGHADHSIPLTLFFKWLAETIGLSEWRLRFIPLLCGVLTVVAVPWVLRPWLQRHEAVLLGLLLALSPLLIHFSRYVRPYAITILLGLLAVVALWRWWHSSHEEGRWRWLLLFMPATILTGWLHPLTLLFTGGAMLWFVLMGLNDLLRHQSMGALVRIMPIAMTTAALTSALLLPPLLSDPWSVAAKAGVDQLQWATVLRAWELMAGTANPWVAWPMLGLMAIGLRVWWQRDPLFLAYWGFITLLALLALLLLNPAWVHHALVPVRYASVALPMVLMAVTLGVFAVARGVGQWLEAERPAMVVLALGLLVSVSLSGPLPDTYAGINQFAGHLRYHFDYNAERNPFTRAVEQVEMPALYQTMMAVAAETSDEVVLIESAWHFESHFSALSTFQRQHQLPVAIGVISGLCTEWTWGEPFRRSDQRWRLGQFVALDDLPWRMDNRHRFVILHRQPLVPPVPDPRPLPPVDDCIEVLRERLGAPWHEDAERVVFRLPVGASAGISRSD